MEGVYGFKPRGSKGFARFKSEDAMWDYMKGQKDKPKPKFGERDLKVHTQSPPQDMPREKAVRKLIRTIIEEVKGPEEQTARKEKIESNYKAGKVWLDGQRVGEWDSTNGKMNLLGEGKRLADRFAELMEQKPQF